MICTFFGHRDADDSIKAKLKDTILQLIKEGVTDFYVGNNGAFDFYVQTVLKDITKEHKVNFSVILSNVNEMSIGADQSYTIFPEGLEKALPKFAISKRNDWMINNSQIAITYVNHHFSSSYKWLEKARKKGVKIINLGTYNSII